MALSWHQRIYVPGVQIFTLEMLLDDVVVRSACPVPAATLVAKKIEYTADSVDLETG